MMERMDRVAHRLIVTSPRTGDGCGVLSLGTGEQHLRPADREGLGGPKAGFQKHPLVRRKWSYNAWCLHTSYDPTCPITLLGNALAKSEIGRAGGYRGPEIVNRFRPQYQAAEAT